jgi:hypothetical protein
MPKRIFMKFKIIDLVALGLAIISWLFLDISFTSKILVTIVFVLFLVVAHLKQEVMKDLDLLNFILGGFSWLLPNINVIYKTLICFVLLSIIVLFRIGVIQYKAFPISKYLKLLMASYIIVYVEYWLFALLSTEAGRKGLELGNFELASFIYVIIFGFPVALYGASKFSQNHDFIASLYFVAVYHVLISGLLAVLWFFFQEKYGNEFTGFTGGVFFGLSGPAVIVVAFDYMGGLQVYLLFIAYILIVIQQLILGRKLLNFKEIGNAPSYAKF